MIKLKRLSALINEGAGVSPTKKLVPPTFGESTIMEMAKRSTADQFYALAKKKYGADKVKSLKWPEIVALAKEADVLIPPYLRTQKVGRGLFNLVPPEHADTKEPAKDEKKAEPQKAEPPKSKGKSLETVADIVFRTFRSASQARHVTQFNKPEPQGKGLMSDMRYWGDWEMPEGEEDDGDYDWEVMTKKSFKEADALIKKLQQEYPEFNIRFSTEEKNWITLHVEPK